MLIKGKIAEADVGLPVVDPDLDVELWARVRSLVWGIVNYANEVSGGL